MQLCQGLGAGSGTSVPVPLKALYQDLEITLQNPNIDKSERVQSGLKIYFRFAAEDLESSKSASKLTGEALEELCDDIALMCSEGIEDTQIVDMVRRWGTEDEVTISSQFRYDWGTP